MFNSISFSDDFEMLLKCEAEKAESMSLLHLKSYEKFSFLSIILNIPVIILSSIIGFLSPLTLFEHQSIFLGSLSILVAILKTIDNYFDLTKRCETHRMTGLNYSRVSKWIQLQLSLEREVRVQAKDLFDIISNELQNIREGEPIIPDDIIKLFNIKYSKEQTSKPAITNGLTKIHINKNSTKKTIVELLRNDIPIKREESIDTKTNYIPSPTNSIDTSSNVSSNSLTINEIN
jgi:hypothetical protein